MAYITFTITLRSFFKKFKTKVENRQGEVKNSIGNIEAKELICTTHGHEPKGAMMVGGGV